MALIFKEEVFSIVGAAIKALDHLSGQEEAQVLNYLKATKFKTPVLINFGSHKKLEWKCLVF